MRNFLISLLFIALLSAALQFLLPWWVIVIPCVLAGYLFRQHGLSAFFSGLLGVALVWWVAAYILDSANNSILSERMAELFGVSGPLVLILISGLVGGLVGGFATLSGHQFKKVIAPETKKG